MVSSLTLLSPSTASSSDHHRRSLSIPRFSGLKTSPVSSSFFAKRTYAPTGSAHSSQGPVVRDASVLQAAETSLVEKSVNTIRFLAVDAVEKANSGYPGPYSTTRYNPKNTYWFSRDRFVLSAGHGCMLQYGLLHLAGYDSVKEEDLKSFRQWGSRTPGHPENFETPGKIYKEYGITAEAVISAAKELF